MKGKSQEKNMIMGITLGIIAGTSIGANKGIWVFGWEFS